MNLVHLNTFYSNINYISSYELVDMLDLYVHVPTKKEILLYQVASPYFIYALQVTLKQHLCLSTNVKTFFQVDQGAIAVVNIAMRVTEFIQNGVEVFK